MAPIRTSYLPKMFKDNHERTGAVQAAHTGTQYEQGSK
jgi:hypothetical protein